MDNYKRIKAAKGEEKCDLVIKNARICDLFTKSIIESDLGITDGVIIGWGKYEGVNEIDAEGSYVMPSFVESHVHIESSMLAPFDYAKLCAIKGVTEVVADPHEIANVAGEEGLKFMLESAKGLPVNIHFMLPSCVPATPFDSSGAVIDSNVLHALLEKYDFYGLGEMMNYPGLLACVPDVVEKLNTDKIIDGHAPLLTGGDLNAYIASGIKTDHECSNVDEALEKISRGMYVLMREGTQSRNIKDLAGAVNPNTLRRFLFCTDDRYLGDVIEHGSISNCIKVAVEMGIDPLDALVVACLNPTECYNLGKRGAIAPSYKADIVISRDLNATFITHVFKDGVLIAKDGKALFEGKNAPDENVRNSVHINPVCAKDFEIEFKKGMDVIEVLPHSLLTNGTKAYSEEGLNMCAVVERHKMTGNIGKCFLKDFGLKGGAIAQSIGHDSHNITVVGSDTKSMAEAVNALGKTGGMSVVKNGKLVAFMPLEIAGIMSDKSAEETLKMHEKILEAVKEISFNDNIDPFMMLSFLSLLVIPNVKISDKGLFDVNKFDFIR
ncbi:MAG: adenine deaminase [Clostridia bacterium]|nr:adenine deaminase [Clostridia bacterium]